MSYEKKTQKKEPRGWSTLRKHVHFKDLTDWKNVISDQQDIMPDDESPNYFNVNLIREIQPP